MKRTGTAYPVTEDSYYPFAEELGKIHLTYSVYEPYLKKHSHGFVELVCITEGCGTHLIDGHSLPAHRGDVFLIDYGMEHDYRPLSENFAWINCIFRPEFLGDIFPVQKNAAQLLSYLYYHSVPADSKKISLACNLRREGENYCPLFEDMLKEYENKAYGYTEVLKEYLTILLTKTARCLFSDTERKRELSHFDRILPEVIRRLNQSAPGSISEKELADSCYMSKSAFSANFKKAMGCSYLEYVTDLKIRQACALLLTTDATVFDIQNRAGYRDTKSFYHAFRRYTGMTPTEYKVSHQKQEETEEAYAYDKL